MQIKDKHGGKCRFWSYPQAPGIFPALPCWAKGKVIDGLSIAVLISLLIFSDFFAMQAYGQKRFNAQFVLQPGNSFISGDWKNVNIVNSPPFKRKITPALEAGVNAVYHFKGKGKFGGKMGYDAVSKSGFYLADKITLSIGIVYSYGGQNYKVMKEADVIHSRNLRLQYLKIPLKFDLVKGKEDKPQLIYTVGVYGGYLIGYKEKNGVTGTTTSSKTVIQGSTIISTYSVNGAPAVSTQYELQSKPFNSIDYGALLGVGMQKKLSPSLFFHIILIGQKGFADIKNKEAQYRDGTNLYPYFSSNINMNINYTNSSLELMIGLKKNFEWTPSQKKEKKRWRLFRLKQ